MNAAFGVPSRQEAGGTASTPFNAEDRMNAAFGREKNK
jgi:hypothetical protein